MLTNLAYAGNGTTTYGDTKVIYNNSSGSITQARYYAPTGSTYTTEPAPPSTLTDGTGQYGYIYNFCAANGGQLGNAACGSSTDPVDPSISVCPKNWRIPTTSEYGALNAAVNGGSTSSDSGLLIAWLGQYSGQYIDIWGSGTQGRGTVGKYWTSEKAAITSGFHFSFSASSTNPALSVRMQDHLAVRFYN